MRVQVNLSDNMVKRIDTIAENVGVSRSALCATIIGQYVMGIEKGFEVLENTAKDLVKSEE